MGLRSLIHESYCISFMYIETDPFSLVSSSVAKSYVQQRFIIDEKTWPASQSVHYIEQSLRIHYQCQCDESERKSDLIPQSIQRNAYDQITLENTSHMYHLNHQILLEDDITKVTTNITEIFSTLNTSKRQKLILIEGPEGIGKSILLKEITYRWANKQLLETFKVVILIHLQDPAVHKIKLFVDLLQYFCKKNCLSRTETENIVACSDQIFENNGYRHGILFSNSSDKLCNLFIFLTICRHLAKHGHSFEHNTYNLTNLPASCDKVFL